MKKKDFQQQKYILELTVFISGAVVMIFEILGSRILGPYMGTSIYVWTSLIGVILGSLSIGYWLGGFSADQKPVLMTLAKIIFFAAICVFATVLIKDYILNFLNTAITDMKWSALFAAIILFSPTSILLGMVTPYAVRLKIKAVESSGVTVGNLYAISTVGSIAGTFLAGYVLIPSFGTTRMLFALALILLIVSLLIFSKWLTKTRVVSLLLLLMSTYIHHQLKISYALDGFIDVDTAYNRVWIYSTTGDRHQKPVLKMRINNENSSIMFLNNDELAEEYTKYFHLVKHFKPDFKRVVMFGGAGYSFPKDYLKKYPEARIDVVEIDPGVTTLAQKYFRLERNARMRIFHEDARTFLNRNAQKYDAILGDAFKSNYALPFHLTTREAVQKQFDMLVEGGVVIVNLISAIEGKKGKFLRAEYATFASIFPQVYLFPVRFPEDAKKVQNIILVALKSDRIPSFTNENPQLKGILQHRWMHPIEADTPVITDDYAPVEYYTAKIFDD